MLRLTLLLDEAVCAFVDLAVLGVIRELCMGCFRPLADTRNGRFWPAAQVVQTSNQETNLLISAHCHHSSVYISRDSRKSCTLWHDQQ